MGGRCSASAGRFRTGLVLYVAIACGLCIYPTYHDERYGRIVDPGSSEERAAIQEKALKRLRREFERQDLM